MRESIWLTRMDSRLRGNDGEPVNQTFPNLGLQFPRLGDLLVIRATATGTATVRAIPQRRHHADLAAATRPDATILVMFVAAGANGDVAGRQRQLRRLSRQESSAGKAMRSSASLFAGHDGNGVEGIRWRALLRNRRGLAGSEQSGERPPWRFRRHGPPLRASEHRTTVPASL